MRSLAHEDDARLLRELQEQHVVVLAELPELREESVDGFRLHVGGLAELVEGLAGRIEFLERPMQLLGERREQHADVRLVQLLEDVRLLREERLAPHDRGLPELLDDAEVLGEQLMEVQLMEGRVVRSCRAARSAPKACPCCPCPYP